MKIPKDAVDRQRLYSELSRYCLRTRTERYDFYKMLRNYRLFGTPSTEGAPYNKIGSTIDTLSSFIYSPASIRFSIHLGATAPVEEIAKVRPLAAELADQWRETGTHLTFGLGVDWSLTYGCMLFKCYWGRRGLTVKLVEPHQFGVLREDVPELIEQEAFGHCYTITRTQLEAELIDHPRRAEILARVGKGSGEEGGSEAYPEGMTRLLLSNDVSTTGSGSGPGGAVAGGLTSGGAASYDYVPIVEAELIDMVELYVWDDEISDYRMVTLANPDIVVYDRKQPGVEGLPCFVKLAPEHSVYDYFWGTSFAAKLTWLQDWRTLRVIQIKDLMERQIKPSWAFPGWTGLTDEKYAALIKAGGYTNMGGPGSSKPEKISADFPSQVFTEVHEIDMMFDDLAGISHVLQGKGEPGVRSRGQADLMARLSSARPKKRAMAVEESAEELATLMLRTIQDNSKQRFVARGPQRSRLFSIFGGKGKDETFIAEQFTKDYEVKVDAHSSSPIFVEDRKHDAIELFNAKAINRAELLEQFDPPHKQVLLEDLKEIEAQEAAAAQAQASREAQGGGGKRKGA